MGEVIKKFPKEKFLEMVSNGDLDYDACKALGFQKATLVQLMVKDPEFKEAVENAKKARADVWYEDIARSVKDDHLTKDEVPAAKLKFEQRKYLAAIDNPDKYAEKSKKEIDLNINIFQEMKDLPASEAKKLLQSVDPFNVVEAEFNSIPSQNATAVQDGGEEDIFS